MAYNNYSDPVETEGNKSKFNEAFLKMHRIHKLQDTINLAYLNPLDKNEILRVYNYNIIISCCNGLLKECWSKLTDDERLNATSLKTAVETCLKKYPIHSSVKNNTNNKNGITLSEANYEILSDWIFKYECKIRELLGRCGYDTQDKEEWDEDEL